MIMMSRTHRVAANVIIIFIATNVMFLVRHISKLNPLQGVS